MIYADTRGKARSSFADALLDSIAPSGGLWAPQQVSPLQLVVQDAAADNLDYCAVAARAAAGLVGDWRDASQLEELFRRAWEDGGVPAPVLRPLEDNLWLLELFHGPSLAFKDYGLFFLGCCFDRELNRQGRRGVALVATSGDTGAAAVAALSSLDCVNLVVLLPKGRISEVQQAQMTRGLADNIHPLLVEGTFDDCQAMAKHCLGQPQLLPEDSLFLSVNSINLGRIMAQMGYYAYACSQLYAEGKGLTFAVPSGNFGNAYSAWLGQAGGLPIDRVLVACNSNDYLHRVFARGELPMPGRAQQTLSSAMDVGVPSNLERMLYEACGRDGEQVDRWLAGRVQEGQQLGTEALQVLQQTFVSYSWSDEQVLEEMQLVRKRYGVVCDPHTALGLRTARKWREGGGEGPVAVVATAHPCKFPQAIEAAGFAQQPLPPEMQQRMSLPARGESIAADPQALAQWIERSFRSEA